MSALAPVTVLLAALGVVIHLVVDGVGLVLAIVFWRRARLAAALALIAFAVAMPVHILNLAWGLLRLSLPALTDESSISLATVRALDAAAFLVSVLVGAAIWALLFTAVFADRPRVPARR